MVNEEAYTFVHGFLDEYPQLRADVDKHLAERSSMVVYYCDFSIFVDL